MTASEQLIAEAITLLKRHDFWFEYADDPRFWQIGAGERDQIFNLLKRMPIDDALGLVIKFVPLQFKEQWLEKVKSINLGL